MLTPVTKQLVSTSPYGNPEQRGRDTFNDGRKSTSRARLSDEHNYGISLKTSEVSSVATLDARGEGRLFPDDPRLTAAVFDAEPTSTELEFFIDGGGKHTLTIPPEAVVLFVKAALEESNRRPHEVAAKAIRHNLTPEQIAALGEVGFAGLDIIPPEAVDHSRLQTPDAIPQAQTTSGAVPMYS